MLEYADDVSLEQQQTPAEAADIFDDRLTMFYISISTIREQCECGA